MFFGGDRALWRMPASPYHGATSGSGFRRRTNGTSGMQSLSKLASLGGTDLGARVLAAAPGIVAGLLVIVLAAQLASLVWKLVAPPPVPVVSTPAAGPTAAINVAGLVNAHLFGSAAVQASGDAASAPTTNLRLVLAGTLAGADPEQGWAIIGETAQSAKVYVTGASVPGGARLKAVYADRVILERGGALESLPLPRITGGAAPTPVVYNRGSIATPPAGSASLAESVQQLVAQNPGAISEIIRPQPVFAGGEQKGYRVYPGRNRAQFAKLGLMPGDLVTAVNGTPLSDPNQGLEMLRSVGEGSPVTLSVERNGQPQQVTVDPSQVLADLPAPGQETPPDPEDE